jgi:hypothetical protein
MKSMSNDPNKKKSAPKAKVKVKKKGPGYFKGSAAMAAGSISRGGRKSAWSISRGK